MPPRQRQTTPSALPVRVLSVPLDQPIITRHLGPLLGALLHWHCGRSVPCQGEGDCLPAIHRTRTIWRAYGPVEGWDSASRLWVPAVLEMTSSGEEYVRARDLRGETWHWSREGDGGKRAPVIGMFCERIEESSCRPTFDILPVLLRFFGVRAIRLGVPNPTPPRVVLESTPGAPPQLPADIQPAPAQEPPPRERRRLREMYEERQREERRREQGEPSSNGQH